MAGTTQETTQEPKRSCCRFGYNKEVDKTPETRNTLLVVATVITAVTFQSGVNPPGGVWQDDSNGHTPGTAIYASRSGAFHVFLTSNTLALSSSILVLMSLTYKFPLFLELWAAIVGMFATYASAVFAISPEESVRSLLSTAALPFVVRFLIQIYKRLDRFMSSRVPKDSTPDPSNLQLTKSQHSSFF